MNSKLWIPSLMSALLTLAGCGAPDTNPNPDPQDVDAEAQAISSGESLFKTATFGGNGRTCETCHSMSTGTRSPKELQALFARNPKAAIFRSIDSDNRNGTTYNRLLSDATILVDIKLPPNVKLASNPSATQVTLERAIPTTLNTPALDPVLMVDGREPTLTAQALSAVKSHAEPKVQPTARELSDIAKFEKTLFSSDALKKFAAGGPAPVLPQGRSDAEKRGRMWFVDEPGNVGLCAFCHGGPMLDTISKNLDFEDPFFPPGGRFSNVLVSEFNRGNRPMLDFIVTLPDGSTTTVSSPDPGRMLITGKVEDAAFFKIPTLWNIKNTAPYFHDNSAKTLEEMVDRYNDFHDAAGAPHITDQDKADIVAFLKLL